MNILDKTATLSAIRAIAKSDGNLRDKIQLVAISALAHGGEHGDTSLMSKLVAAVNATTATQLRKYFKEYAPVQYNKGKGTFTKVRKGGAFRVADAMDHNWYDELEAKKLAAAAYDADKLSLRVTTALEKYALEAAEAGDTDTANRIAAALVAASPVTLKVAA